jgi:ABC-type Fe3+/spermidine/putrescine transport system ATPase subunit
VKYVFLSILLTTTLATLSGSSVKATQTPPATPGRRFSPATIYITHDRAEAKAFTARIVQMEAGRIVC